MNTKEFIRQQCLSYPTMQPSDLCKALYQSTFGCGHLVGNPSAAAGYIRREAAFSIPNPMYIEPLDGDYSRVYLSVLDTGLSAETFAKLFALSAARPTGNLSLLEEKLNVVSELQEILPFSWDAWETEITAWKNAGYPACHHSESYRETYHPAYRLLHNDYIRFLPVFAKIDQAMQQDGGYTVAIEGGSASGKSTLAKLLQSVYDGNVIHMDDFFLQPQQRTDERLSEIGGNIDYERFAEEILPAIKKNQAITYRPFDCSVMTLREPITLPAKKLTIVEGAYSTHPNFGTPYDLTVYLHISPQLQQTRIQKRNTPIFQKRFFEVWIPMEQRYFSHTKVEDRCDLTIDILS